MTNESVETLAVVNHRFGCSHCGAGPSQLCRYEQVYLHLAQHLAAENVDEEVDSALAELVPEDRKNLLALTEPPARPESSREVLMISFVCLAIVLLWLAFVMSESAEPFRQWVDDHVSRKKEFTTLFLPAMALLALPLTLWSRRINRLREQTGYDQKKRSYHEKKLCLKCWRTHDADVNAHAEIAAKVEEARR